MTQKKKNPTPTILTPTILFRIEWKHKADVFGALLELFKRSPNTLPLYRCLADAIKSRRISKWNDKHNRFSWGHGNFALN